MGTELRTIMKDFEYTSARGINDYLKTLASDELRMNMLNVVTDGICQHCGAISDSCNCMNDANPLELLVMRDSVAKEVFLALEEDGYYGPYTLGDELWERFRAAYINCLTAAISRAATELEKTPTLTGVGLINWLGAENED